MVEEKGRQEPHLDAPFAARKLGVGVDGTRCLASGVCRSGGQVFRVCRVARRHRFC